MSASNVVDAGVVPFSMSPRSPSAMSSLSAAAAAESCASARSFASAFGGGPTLLVTSIRAQTLAAFHSPAPRGPSLHIYVDADACPVKNEIYRVAERYGLPVTLVSASPMRIPSLPDLTLEVVAQGFDAADDWIVAHAGRHDIVVTTDIPLAARCLERGAYALGPTGRPFTESNIGDALATRNLLSELRGAGLDSSGPPPFDARDRSRFLQALDQAVHSLRRAIDRGDR